MRKLTFGLLLGLLILSCGQNTIENTVSWKPAEFLFGTTAKIYYNPQGLGAQILNPTNLVCIVTFSFSDSAAVQVLPMERAGKKFKAVLSIPESAKMVSFKFEDDTGLTEDNARRGWNFIVQNKNSAPTKNSRELLAKTFDGRSRPAAVPEFKIANALYQADLAGFPENASAWYGRWYCLLNQSEKTENTIQQIAREADSLTAVFAGNPDFLKVAFDANQVLLQNKEKAQILGDTFIAEYPTHPDAGNVALRLLKYKLSKDVEKNRNQLVIYKQSYSQSSDMLLINSALVRNYLQTAQVDQAIKLQLENVELHPDDFREALNQARLYLRTKEIKLAETYLEQAFSLCTMAKSREDSPWIDGFERQIQWRIDRAGLFSASAELLVEKGDYAGSIEARRKAIAEGSPFPGYEYDHIGQAFLAANQPDSATYAFVMALTRNPDHKGAMNGLHHIFKTTITSHQSFLEWVQHIEESIISENQKVVTDFSAIDMDGNRVRLSKARGKTVVICFGATPLWEDEAQLVELNRLAGILDTDKRSEFWAFSIESKTTLAAFLKKKTTRFKIVSDAGKIQKVLNIQGFPTYIVIDSDGIERFRQVGNSYRITEKLVSIVKQLNSEISGK